MFYNNERDGDEYFVAHSRPFDAECAACGGKRVQRNTQPPQPCVTCDGRGFGEPVVCKHCKGKGSTEEFFQGRVVVPAGAAAGRGKGGGIGRVHRSNLIIAYSLYNVVLEKKGALD